MFVESNPSPVKAALALRGTMKDAVQVADLSGDRKVACSDCRRPRHVREGLALMRIAVVGASGRMGRAIVRLAREGGIESSLRGRA